MRVLAVFRKSVLEQLRAPLSLVLALAAAPLFVLLYWLWLGGGSTAYPVLVLNEDRQGAAGAGLVRALQERRYPGGASMLAVALAADRGVAEVKLRNREAAALVIVPADFSRAIERARLGGAQARSSVVLAGDLTNPQYVVAALVAGAAADDYVQAAAHRPNALRIVEEPLAGSGTRTEFEIYVPALLVLAVIMLIFPTSMSVAGEVEAGTLRRLQLTRMTAFDYLAGISAAHVLVGIAAVVLTFLTACALGFHSRGPLCAAIVVGAVTALSIIGVGLLVACFARTVSEAFLIANFPLLLLMFFSGAVYPMPRVPLFELGGHGIALFDILPATHAVIALNKVLTLGAGLDEVAYELAAMLVLSLGYFGAGIWLFGRMRLRTG